MLCPTNTFSGNETIRTIVSLISVAAEEQSSKTAGKSFKERESFDGRSILKVSMKNRLV